MSISNLNPILHFPFIRSYLREIRKFPDPITRSYLLNLLHKRCKRPYGTHPERVQTRILKSINFLETVRLKVAAANSGHLSVFEELLKEAFARTGERREKFLEPYLKPSPQQIPNTLTYPESKFPIYPPLLTKLITSSQTNQLRTIPSKEDLQFISPTSVITTRWSDLPEEHQPDLSHLGKAKGMGTMSSSRQINHRMRLRSKWVNGLLGAPLGVLKDETIEGVESFEKVSDRIEKEFGTRLSVEMVRESQEMLKELEFRSTHKGSSGTPRYAIRSSSTVYPIGNLDPIESLPNRNRIPNKLPTSHPFFPKPINYKRDPIEELLPKRSRMRIKDNQVCLKNGPRTLTHRFIRRRYQSVLNLVPLISFPVDHHSSKGNGRDKRKGKDKGKEDGKKEIDRDWITPESATGKKVFVKRAGVGLGNGRVGICEMEHEDLVWL